MVAYANTLKHFLWAREQNFGSVGSGIVPDISGLTMVAAPVNATSVVRVSGLQAVEDGTVRTGFAPRPPKIDSAWDVANGRWYDRGPADVSVELLVRNYGTGSTNVTSSDELFLADALGTLLSASVAATASVTVTGAGGDAGEAEVSAALVPGELVMVAQGGKYYLNRVTGYSAGTGIATFLTHFPSALGTSTVIYRGTTLSASSGADTGTRGPTLALEIAASSGKTVATGCVLTSCELTIEGGLVKAALTFSAAYTAQTDGPITVVGPEFQAGAYDAAVLLSCARYGTAVTPTTGPASVASGELGYMSDGFSIKIEATVTPVSPGAGCTLLGMAGMVVTGLKCTATWKTHDPNSTFNADFLGGRQRAYAFPFGPVTTGNGVGVLIPAGAVVENPAVYDISGELTEQAVTVVAGPYSGDDGSASAAVNSDFAVFFCGV